MLVINKIGDAIYLNQSHQLHREDGPAVERFEDNGYKIWYLNGNLHRDNGPAYESKHYQAWYLNDMRHRENGPAIIRHQISDDNSFVWLYGYKAWYYNGQRHRLDGPAIEYGDDSKEWYYHGKKIKVTTQVDFEIEIQKLK